MGSCRPLTNLKAVLINTGDVMKANVSWFNRSLLAVLTLGLLTAACSEQGAPDQIVGPASEASSSLSLGDDIYKIAQGQPIDRAEYKAQVIGPDGGVVYVDAHYLYVPQGAVTGPTLFEIKVRRDGQIGASLDATSLSAQGVLNAVKNNVGRAGFAKPVYLTFYYGYATNFGGNPQKIKVLWIRPDGRKIAQPTYVNESYKVATGVVSHFSDYGLGWP
jgi:hypothetical protein